MNPIEIIERFYTEGSLRDLLLIHSRKVAAKALEAARIYETKHPDMPAPDYTFIEEAALLHDIGIVFCDAPSIHCHGFLPYICHGIKGAEMLRSEGLPRHALVCERHTGSGLSKDNIRDQLLPLPLRDMLPLSIEEKAICYADKFFSKSGDPTEEKDLKKVINSMARHGEDSYHRFIELHSLFS